MAQVKRSIEVGAPAERVHEEWLRFEDLPRCPAHALAVNVRWRAEVLSFQPISSGTRITLKLEFDPGGADEGLPRRLEAVLKSFTAFFEARLGSRAVAQPA